MAKPGTLPEWATDETNNTAPSSGQQDTGWTPNQVAVSSYFNWLFFWIYKWIFWLNDIVPGASTLPVQITSGGVFTVSDDLAVDTITATTVETTGDITTTGGEYKFDTPLQLVIPASMARDVFNTHTLGVTGMEWTLVSSPNRIVYPISLPVGSRITAFELALEKNTTNSITQGAQIHRMLDDGTESAVGAGASNSENSPAPGAMSVISETGINHTVASFYQYYLIVFPDSGGAGDIIRHLNVFYDRP